ncbi:MAG TPA: type IX secretion system protein PorQ [Paludibacteraceae bacterium]|nr:type IX secretion system protein PorQ [Paludibacteraceae bacterium]
MKRKISLSLLFWLNINILIYSQAGQGVYKFLDLPVSSRIAGLGGTNVSIRDNDLNFAFRNPALLTANTHHSIALNYANYLSDIQFGSVIFGENFKDKHYTAYGIQYVDYGTFKETTEQNEIIGEFTAKDMAFYIMYAYPLNEKITVGGTFKPVYSVYERYSSFGLALDAGISYNDINNLFSLGLVLRNVGTQLKGYYSDEEGQHYEALPFDIQLGATKKLAHAPLRFSFTLHNLQNWDMEYLSSTGTKKIDFFDNLFRHFIVGLEFIPSNNFYLIAAYNYRQSKEMKIEDFKSMAGFSFGGGVKLYKFQVGFGINTFQVGNYSYQFSIATSLDAF